MNDIAISAARRTNPRRALPRRLMAPALLVAGLLGALLVGSSGPASADAGAANLITQWSNQIGDSTRYKVVDFTATQGGGPSGSMPDALFGSGILTRNANGSLRMSQVKILYADRSRYVSGVNQPFDASKPDVSDLTFTLAGNLVQHSETWGFTDTQSLSALPNNLLGGWGTSIGNQGAPTYWVIGATRGVYNIPG